jgi:flagellar assembly protein FliH
LSNIVKANFIQFSAENTKVIDTNSLVAKRLEGFSGVLRESLDDEDQNSAEGQANNSDMDPLAMAELLADRDDNGEPIDEGFEVEGEPIDDVKPSSETAEDISKMKEEALAEIERVKETARAEVEELRERARQEGYSEGYFEGTKKAEEEANAKFAEIEDKKAELEAEYRKLIDDLEPRMVETITDVYRSVFGDSFYSKKDVMKNLILAALFNADSSEEVTIRVSPIDFETVDSLKEELKERAAVKGELSVVSDERLTATEAKVETPFGIMDCSIDTEVEELTKTLRALSYGGR